MDIRRMLSRGKKGQLSLGAEPISRSKSTDSTPDVLVKTVANWVNNPVSRFVLRSVSSDCPKCGRKLDLCLRKYSGEDVKLCRRCGFHYKVVSAVVTNAGRAFGLSREEMQKMLAYPVLRRGLVNVIKGISIYGITKPQVTAAPFMVVWDWTHLCNLRCKHCYINAGQRLENELTTAEAKNLVDDLEASGVVAISFAGGEPLMRSDFFEVAAYEKQKGMYVSVATNGTLITPEIARRLKGVANYVEVSVDGANSRTHDAFRGIPGVFDRTMEGIRNAVEAGNYTCMATTVTKANLHEAEEIYQLAKRLGVKMLIFFNFIPSGRGKDNMKLDLTPYERESFLDFIYSKMSLGSEPYVCTTAPQLGRVCMNNGTSIPTHFFSQEIIGKYSELCEFIGGCGAGRLYCSIEPTGDVQPCVFMHIKVGNVRESSIKEIWHGSEVLDKLRDRSKLQGSCGKCENKYVCGGCRARAFSYFGDTSAPDIGCINNSAYWESVNAPVLALQVKSKAK